MCCCGKPNVNGEPGYNWNTPNGKTSVHPVNAPALPEGFTLLYDEPGRCGGIDSHSHHYRVATNYGSLYLLVRHGGGEERIRLSLYNDTLATLDSNARYWMLNAIAHAHSDAMREAREREAGIWRKAAAQKRIKTRKLQRPREGLD